jgi:hypothetical protein
VSVAAAQAAPEKNSNHCVVALSAQATQIKNGQKVLSLVGRKPVSDLHTVLSRSFDTTNTSGEIGTQQASIRRFVSKTSHCSQAQIDCRRRIVCLLKSRERWSMR